MAKMVTTPIHGKNVLKSPERTIGLMTLECSMLHLGFEVFQGCSNDDPRRTLTY